MRSLWQHTSQTLTDCIQYTLAVCRIVQHNEGRFSAELEKTGLQVFSRAPGNDPADVGRTGEVDSPDGWMIYQRAHHSAGVFGSVGDDVHHVRRKAGLAQCFDDQRMGTRADFRGFQDD